MHYVSSNSNAKELGFWTVGFFVFLTPGSCCTKGFEALTNTLQTQEGVLQEKGVEIILNQTSSHFDSCSTAVYVNHLFVFAVLCSQHS